MIIKLSFASVYCAVLVWKSFSYRGHSWTIFYRIRPLLQSSFGSPNPWWLWSKHFLCKWSEYSLGCGVPRPSCPCRPSTKVRWTAAWTERDLKVPESKNGAVLHKQLPMFLLLRFNARYVSQRQPLHYLQSQLG